jgi:hypothetical protein
MLIMRLLGSNKEIRTSNCVKEQYSTRVSVIAFSIEISELGRSRKGPRDRTWNTRNGI